MNKDFISSKKQNNQSKDTFFSSKSLQRESFFPPSHKLAAGHNKSVQKKDDDKPKEESMALLPNKTSKNDLSIQLRTNIANSPIQMLKLKKLFKKIGKKIGRLAKKALKFVKSPLIMGLIKKGLAFLPGIGTIINGFSVLGKLGSLGGKIAKKVFSSLAKFKGKFSNGILSKVFKFLGKIKKGGIGKIFKKIKGMISGWVFKGKSLLGSLAKKLLIKFLLLFDKRKKPDFSNPAKKQQVLLRARLAKAVYGNVDAALLQQQTGFALATPLQLADLAITSSDLRDDGSGFYAEIYTDTSTPTKYMLAFRGSIALTNFLSTSSYNRKDAWNDWFKTNLPQSLGIETRQYKKAAALAIKMKNAVGADGFEIVGHSLGGGLASVAAAVTGAKATTFNAAGLHEKTTTREGVSATDRNARAANVEAYSSKTDPLTLFQNYSPLPDAYGTQYVLNSKGHGIDTIITELEK